MRSLLVIVREIILNGTLQAAPANEPAAANAFTLYGTNPALGKCIQIGTVQIGTVRRNGDRLDAATRQGVSPSRAELDVAVLNQVAGADLGKSPVSAIVRLRAV